MYENKEDNNIILKVDDVEIVIKDIDDPGVMDQITCYIELVKDSSKKFMELLISQLPRMHVTWDSPWYQQMLSFTKSVTEVPEGMEPFRTDKFSKAEGDQVDKNWKMFIKEFGLPNKPVCFARWKSTDTGRARVAPVEKARRFVMQYLSRGLERTLNQVHTHFEKKHLHLNNGMYTKTEQKLAQIVFENVSEPVAVLRVLLDRSQRGLYKLLASISSPQSKVKMEKKKWTQKRSGKLFRCMLKHSELSKEKLKYHKLDRNLWLKIEEDMKFPYSNLKKHWLRKLHTQIYVEEDIKLNKTRRKILRRLRETNYQVWTDINWNELVPFFPDGCTSEFIYYTFLPLLKKHANFYWKLPLSDVLDIATDVMSQQKCRNKRLKRFSVKENNHLEPIMYKS